MRNFKTNMSSLCGDMSPVDQRFYFAHNRRYMDVPVIHKRQTTSVAARLQKVTFSQV